MSDTQRHVIPRRLDDPERWLFWTVDEAAVLMGPALLGGLIGDVATSLVAALSGMHLPDTLSTSACSR